jgi:hypothetical protein
MEQYTIAALAISMVLIVVVILIGIWLGGRELPNGSE